MEAGIAGRASKRLYRPLHKDQYGSLSSQTIPRHNRLMRSHARVKVGFAVFHKIYKLFCEEFYEICVTYQKHID